MANSSNDLGLITTQCEKIGHQVCVKLQEAAQQ